MEFGWSFLQLVGVWLQFSWICSPVGWSLVGILLFPWTLSFGWNLAGFVPQLVGDWLEVGWSLVGDWLDHPHLVGVWLSLVGLFFHLVGVWLELV